MNKEEKRQLNKLIKENNIEDTTDYIRTNKVSDIIRTEIESFLNLKKTHARWRKSNPSHFEKMCITKCHILHTKYNDIFKQLLDDTLDIQILDKLLIILKNIELGKLNQHEGSYYVGQLLKTLYIDKELKSETKNETKNETNETESKTQTIVPKNISWSDYKKMIE
jgi:hypothetical protein